IPTGDMAEADLRGFEWHYLHRLSRHQLTLDGFRQDILDVAFSPDGSRLASACWDGKVRVHDVKSGREVLTLKAWTQLVYCLAFSPDGARLAAGAGIKVQVWEAATGRELVEPMRDASSVYRIALSAVGIRLARSGAC